MLLWLLPLLISLGPLEAQNPRIQRLAAQLQSPEKALRHKAAQGLGRIGDPQSVELLRRAMPAEKEASIRLEMLRGLRNIAFLRLAGYRDALKVIGQAADPTTEPDRLVRLRAVQALWEAGKRDLLDPVPFLGRALTDPDPRLRLAGVQMLRKLGTPQTIEVLGKAAADKNQSETIRLNAIEALGAVALADAGPVGRQTIEANADIARRLGKTPYISPRALIPWHQIQIRHLSAIINDPDNSPTLMLRAVKSMGNVKDKAAVPTLRQIVAAHPNPTVRLQASQVLSHTIARQFE